MGLQAMPRGGQPHIPPARVRAYLQGASNASENQSSLSHPTEEVARSLATPAVASCVPDGVALRSTDVAIGGGGDPRCCPNGQSNDRFSRKYEKNIKTILHSKLDCPLNSPCQIQKIAVLEDSADEYVMKAI